MSEGEILMALLKAGGVIFDTDNPLPAALVPLIDKKLLSGRKGEKRLKQYDLLYWLEGEAADDTLPVPGYSFHTSNALCKFAGGTLYGMDREWPDHYDDW